VYSRKSYAKSNHDSTGWNREHVWPKSYGVGYSGADYSDLLSLRAADWNVNSARNNLYFDNVVCEYDDTHCDRPAHSEAHNTTAKTSQKFMPPESQRGDIARSIFYMATRYDGSDDDANCEKLTVTLTLSVL
jgi:endonuclease I